ncbi:hypothetical protein F5Y00DRAFT_259175 [Daldinia vernicosa]|uniref:uncharacterized protein n=1 Tax=Daldinia vernicosa TaxID=114800 RepID=UPI00200804F6|nr:uncharacterized protein F5Y00DRAFT_259175 [Daldinia vernicosa]KAI0851685.1 hypothetical protein F5Y00DRAFT_259175 [Daldinia vernicosa]
MPLVLHIRCQGFYFDSGSLSSVVAGSNSVKIANASNNLDKAYLVSWTNSRSPNLAQTVKKITEGAGDYQVLLDTGAQALLSGCGVFSRLLEEGEIGITKHSLATGFGCDSSREQAATTIPAKQIPLGFAGSFGNIFNSILLSLSNYL